MLPIGKLILLVGVTLSVLSFVCFMVKLTKQGHLFLFNCQTWDAKDGGSVAGATRKDIEKRLGKSVVSSNKFLEIPEKKKRIDN